MNIVFNAIAFSVFCFLLSDCKEKKTSPNVLETVDIESNIDNFKELLLSQFNAEIHYIPLKNDNNLNISWIKCIDATSDLILVSDHKLCLLYDYTGSIFTKVGEIGRGPAEYNGIANVGFGFNNIIFIQGLDDFLEYKTDGTFVRRFDVQKEVEDPSFYMLSWVSINDSLFFGQVPLSTGREKSKAIIFDINGITMQEFKNYIFLNRPRKIFSTEDYHTSFYWYKGMIHFKEMMNDTLFCLTDKYELSPILSFKIGKYAPPKESREIVDIVKFNTFNYVYVYGVYEISDFFIIYCDIGKHIPVRRITPLEVMGQQTWYNSSFVLGLYSKKNKSLVFSKPTSTDNPLFTTGFYNDIDAGPRFHPVKQVNDSTLVMWIEAKQFKDHIASDEFKNNVPKYPEKKKELKELAKSISEFDNPILMFVTFKK